MKKCFIRLLALGTLFASAYSLANPPSADFSKIAYHAAHDTNLSSKAVETALQGYQWALQHGKVSNKNILSIVDFTISSAEPRLYVFNTQSGEVLMGLHVSHGKNSGTGAYATSFSNTNSSLKSSIGVFVTLGTYYGQHGYSLRINGLEASNNNVLRRAVVVHGASYVTPEYIARMHRSGNSWGCFAVNPEKLKLLINYIKDGSVLYAYGHSQEYVATSKIFKTAAADSGTEQNA